MKAIEDRKASIKANTPIKVDEVRPGGGTGPNNVHPVSTAPSAGGSTEVSTGASTLIKTLSTETSLTETPSTETPSTQTRVNSAGACSAATQKAGAEEQNQFRQPTLEEVQSFFTERRIAPGLIRKWLELFGHSPLLTKRDWRQHAVRTMVSLLMESGKAMIPEHQTEIPLDAPRPTA